MPSSSVMQFAHKKMKPVQSSSFAYARIMRRINKRKSNRRRHNNISNSPAPTPLLKSTTMGRIIGNIVKSEGSSERLKNGLEWYNMPRDTRNNPSQIVSRKTTGAVNAINDEAVKLLTTLFSSATDATAHAKRKTLMKADMDLVHNICAKNGLSVCV